jgi:uncharacterized protein (TIGR00369 family)
MDWKEITPRDANFEHKIRKSFAGQDYMRLIGAKLGQVEHGNIEIILPTRQQLNQQHGFFHGGVTAALADSAAGFAALSVFEVGAGILTSEFKINFLRPAQGNTMIARGHVLKAGNLLTVCQADVFTDDNHVATALLTMVKVASPED